MSPLVWILAGAVLATLALAAGGPRLAPAALALDRVASAVATALACAALAIAALAGLWQVIARFATETPAAWSEALVRTALIWMAMLGLAAAIRTGALVSIDIAHRLAPRPLRRGLEAATLAMSLSLMAVLVWFGWTMAERVSLQEMAGLEVSIAWGYAAIPVGAGFAIIGAVAQFLDRRSEELEAAV
jgi:TRAP-type C4-dicarboxylate transport system permease small subunit